MKARSWLAAASLAILVCSVAPHAGAEDAQAHAARAFAEGEEAFASAEYARAAKLFDEAYSARPHPASLANAAKAHRSAGHLARAANHYRRLEREAISAHDVEEARTALAEIRPAVGLLLVRTGPTVSSPSVDGAAIGGPETFVEPGEHVVEGVSGREVVRRVVRVARGETLAVVLEREGNARDEPPSRPIADARAPGAPERTGLSPWLTLVAGGATLIATGATVWSGVDTLEERRAWDESPSNRTLDVGLEKQARTNVLIAVSAGLGLVTGVLAVFTDWRAAPFGAGRSHGGVRRAGFSF